jgi:hypothetical protein
MITIEAFGEGWGLNSNNGTHSANYFLIGKSWNNVLFVSAVEMGKMKLSFSGEWM